MEEMRFYFKGLKYKRLRVPIQRLCVILPVEEQEGPQFLKKTFDDNEVIVRDDDESEVISVGTGDVDVESSLARQVCDTADIKDQGEDDLVDEKLVKPADIEVDFVGDEPFEVEDFFEVELGENQKLTRRVCVQNYKLSILKKVRKQKTSSFVQLLHKAYNLFDELWKHEAVEL